MRSVTRSACWPCAGVCWRRHRWRRPCACGAPGCASAAPAQPQSHGRGGVSAAAQQTSPGRWGMHSGACQAGVPTAPPSPVSCARAPLPTCRVSSMARASPRSASHWPHTALLLWRGGRSAPRSASACSTTWAGARLQGRRRAAQHARARHATSSARHGNTRHRHRRASTASHPACQLPACQPSNAAQAAARPGTARGPAQVQQHQHQHQPLTTLPPARLPCFARASCAW